MDLLNWNKVKHINLPHSNLNWSKTHMQTPVPYMYKNRLFVFYGTRDIENVSSISWVQLDFENNFKIIKSPKKPLLSKGELGFFDDSGVIPSSIIKIKNNNCFSVQYHPEAGPGPHDSSYLFRDFYEMIDNNA